MNKSLTGPLDFINLWQQDPGCLREEIVTLWREHSGLRQADVEKRLGEIVFVIRDAHVGVVGISSAHKGYVSRLKNHLYGVRLIIAPPVRQPGLSGKLMVMTRDFLESHHRQGADECIGIVSLVESKEHRVRRREAIWQASEMVYIGNTPKGNHLRVYYFKDALIG